MLPSQAQKVGLFSDKTKKVSSEALSLLLGCVESVTGKETSVLLALKYVFTFSYSDWARGKPGSQA